MGLTWQNPRVEGCIKSSVKEHLIPDYQKLED